MGAAAWGPAPSAAGSSLLQLPDKDLRQCKTSSSHSVRAGVSQSLYSSGVMFDEN